MIIDKQEALKRAQDLFCRMDRMWSASSAVAAIEAAILQAVQDTAKECAQIVVMADIATCGGYEVQDDARATLRNANDDIMRAYFLSKGPAV
jgi:hypothetical protein